MLELRAFFHEHSDILYFVGAYVGHEAVAAQQGHEDEPAAVDVVLEGVRFALIAVIGALS